MKIQIRKKNVYGNDLNYPANETARQFADLLEKKTLPESAIKQIAAMGYEIEVVL